jgi:hypothetical protein
MTLREALLAMGYREVAAPGGPDRWLKPVGYHLFVVVEATRTWTNVFVDGHGKISVYASQALPERDYLAMLKEAEAYTRINIDASTRSHFELTAIDL